MTGEEPDVLQKLRDALAALGGAGVPGAGRPGGGTSDAGSASGSASSSTSATSDSAGLSEAEREEEQLAKAICLRLLADSARPRAGLEQKLLRKGISESVTGRVLDRFTEVGLIDDQAYAEAYVRTKHQERALSRYALAAELRRKGVDDSFVGVAVEQLDTDAEESRATALVASRIGSALLAGPEAARRRLLGLLDRRGYPAEMSIRVVDGALGHRAEAADH